MASIKDELEPPSGEAAPNNLPSSDASLSSREPIEKERQRPTDPDNQDLEADPPQAPSPASFGPPPDGGFQAWLTVAGGFCTVFASFGWINCIGVFQDYYQTHQLSNFSPSAVAWIPATESFMLFFWGIVSGKMTDNLGPRIPLLLGTLLHVFGLMMTSISHKYYQIFLAQSVCSAIGCSFLFYPTIAACGTWFLKHRALAFGIMVSGSSIGGVVLPIMVNHLVISIGFGWAMRSTAFLLLGLLVFGNLAVSSRLPPLKRPITLKDFITPFTEVPFLLLAIGCFFGYWGVFLPFNFIIVQGRAQGMSNNLAGYLVPIINGASTIGRILPGHLGDKFGVFNVMIIFTAACGILPLALWLPASSSAPLIVFAALYGFFSGCTLSILPALVAQISDIRKLGVRNGVLYAFTSFGVLTGSPIGGAIVNAQHGGFSGLKIFCGVTLLISTLFVILSRQQQVGLKLKVKI